MYMFRLVPQAKLEKNFKYTKTNKEILIERAYSYLCLPYSYFHRRGFNYDLKRK